jgi:hypothetical protein
MKKIVGGCTSFASIFCHIIYGCKGTGIPKSAQPTGEYWYVIGYLTSVLRIDGSTVNSNISLCA